VTLGALPVWRAVVALSAALLAQVPGGLKAQDTVSVPASDGGLVAADIYGQGPHGVVLAHGGRFDKRSWRDQARALAGAGFRVIAIDFRAAVQARAGKETPCLYDAACLSTDVLAAVRYLRRKGAQSVAVVGGSLGGGAAAQASVDAAPGEIDRLVLLAHMPIDHPERMQGRKLFITSRDDLGSGDRPRLPGIREQYERAPEPKELIVLDGSAHAQFIFATEHGERLMAEILRFLTQR
jgi:acetyl esterase/lipase